MASDVARASGDACAAALRLQALRLARHVVLYAPRPGELDPRGIAEGAVPTYYPRVDGDVLRFHRASIGDLVPGAYGIPEPVPDAPELPRDADRIAIVVPGLAFDRRGGRLGSGKGYYDRTLARHPAAVRVGVVVDAALVEHLPTDPWDVSMHAVVTDRHLVVVDQRVVDVFPGEPSWT